MEEYDVRDACDKSGMVWKRHMLIVREWSYAEHRVGEGHKGHVREIIREALHFGPSLKSPYSTSSGLARYNPHINSKARTVL